MKVLNSCGTLRRVDNPGEPLREPGAKGARSGCCWPPVAARRPWRDCTCAQTTTVHQTDDLDFVPVLPGGNGGQP